MLETVKFHIIGALCALTAAVVSFASGTATFAEPSPSSISAPLNPSEYIFQEPNHKIRICTSDCKSDFGYFQSKTNTETETIKVLSYSIGGGTNLNGQIAFLQKEAPADVMLLTDVDWGCKRSSDKNIAREFARSLGYNYVFAGQTKNGCTNGHAILARYPIGNPTTTKLPGLNSDIVLAVDIEIGNSYLHFIISRLAGGAMQNELRSRQANYLAGWAAQKPFHSVVAGDFKTSDYIVDAKISDGLNRTHASFTGKGFEDSHIEFYPEDRITSNVSRDIFDFIFARKLTTYKPGICQNEKCAELSDHLPIWTYISLERNTMEPVD